MSIPTDYDMNKILPVLQSFGVAPNQLGPDKLNELMSLSEHISVPSKITPEITNRILNILGIGVRGYQRPVVRKETKIGRNNPCPCDSRKKYKKCCGQN